MTRILLAGESWSTTSIHSKGFDSFITTHYEEGAGHFIAALEAAGHDVVFQPNHVASDRFPSTSAELDAFDVVVLSDIGSNTLLLPSTVFQSSRRMPNRLQVLADWVRDGGALLMVGGYLSFQGIEAKANYRATALADVLPVEMEIGDDRQECPEGTTTVLTGEHEITRGIASEWPHLLGYHRLIAKPTATVLATASERPMLVVDGVGAGRVAVFASDMGPHWLPAEFIAWDGFARLWPQLISWLAAPAMPRTKDDE